MNKAIKRVLIIGLMAVLYSFMLCACSKPIEVQIQEQLDLGQKYLTEMNYEQAVIAFTKAIELDEKNIAAYEGLGSVYMEQNNYSDAIDTYEKLLELDNKNPSTYHDLSLAYKEAGQIEDEIELLEAAASEIGVNQLIPEDRDRLFTYYCEKAEIHQNQHEEELAVEYYRKAMEIKETKELAEILKSLEKTIEKRNNQKSFDELISIAEQAYGKEDRGHDCMGGDFNGDGFADVFCAFCEEDSEARIETWSMYYIDSQGKDIQRVYEYSIDMVDPGLAEGHGCWIFEKETKKYWVHYNSIGDWGAMSARRYFIFSVENETALLVADGYEADIEELKAGNVDIG